MTSPKIAGARITTYNESPAGRVGPLPAGARADGSLSPPPQAPGAAGRLAPANPAGESSRRHPLPYREDEVSYRCAALGQFYPARVIAVRADGTLDVDVLCSPPLALTKRPWWGDDPRACPRRSCTVPGLTGSIEDGEEGKGR